MFLAFRTPYVFPFCLCSCVCSTVCPFLCICPLKRSERQWRVLYRKEGLRKKIRKAGLRFQLEFCYLIIGHHQTGCLTFLPCWTFFFSEHITWSCLRNGEVGWYHKNQVILLGIKRPRFFWGPCSNSVVLSRFSNFPASQISNYRMKVAWGCWEKKDEAIT